MNTKIYLKLLICFVIQTFYCSASLLDELTSNHTQRERVYNGERFTNAQTTNFYTNTNNSILSNESDVDEKKLATLEQKQKIAEAVFGAAMTDMHVGENRKVKFIQNRINPNPYQLDQNGNIQVKNPGLLNHFRVLYWLDRLARDVVKRIYSDETVIINESLLNQIQGYDDLYMFRDFSKNNVAQWLNNMRVGHHKGFALVVRVPMLYLSKAQ